MSEIFVKELTLLNVYTDVTASKGGMTARLFAR